MDLIQRQLHVAFDLRVFFTEDVFSPENALLKTTLLQDKTPPACALVIVDEALAAASAQLPSSITAYFQKHQPDLSLVCPPVLMEGGEQAKNHPHHVEHVHRLIEQHAICRHSYVIAVGGGALLDVVGFAAATAHRGVRHIRIPSTVLSQDDSGVGVKNGINAFGKKNFIGTFSPPYAVINDFKLLQTLPDREKRAGYVEAVKVALIRDRAFFERLERDAARLAAFESEPMRDLIRRCAELHVNHIATGGDPFEFGSARPLDFGHWSAHKLEQLSKYRIRHGEAVAIGIALDVIYSELAGMLAAADAERILQLLERLGFQLFARELLCEDAKGQLMLVRGLEEFREHLGGELTITLLQGIGDGVEVHSMDSIQIHEALARLQKRASGLAA